MTMVWSYAVRIYHQPSNLFKYFHRAVCTCCVCDVVMNYVHLTILQHTHTLLHFDSRTCHEPVANAVLGRCYSNVPYVCYIA